MQEYTEKQRMSLKFESWNTSGMFWVKKLLYQGSFNKDTFYRDVEKNSFLNRKSFREKYLFIGKVKPNTMYEFNLYYYCKLN